MNHTIQKAPEVKNKSVLFDLAAIMQDALPRLRNTSYREDIIINKIIKCRTIAMRGHAYACNSCEHKHYAFNSCRDRHCPKCGALSKYLWLEARKREILNVQYFHLVFTLPACLYDLILYNKKVGYTIMFKAMSETIQEACLNPKNIGAKAGLLAILHTWNQQLLFHPHLHVIIPGGGLSDDHMEWIPATKNYFINNIKLSLIYRGKFISKLKKAYKKDEFDLRGKLNVLSEKNEFEKLLDKSCKYKWVVYAKETFSNSEKVYDYLGRYTHRVAISNDRIKEYKNGTVSFTYKDRKDGDKIKRCSLSNVDFIKRFLLHILPKNFYKIRYYGFLGNAVRTKCLEECREALGMKIQEPKETECATIDFISIMSELDRNILKCPKCDEGLMVIYKTIYPEDST